MEKKVISFLYIVIMIFTACNIKGNVTNTAASIFPFRQESASAAVLRPPSIVRSSSSPYTYNEMKADINELKNRYGLSVSSIGRSVLGRDIPVLKIGTGSKKIIVVGSTHGLEYITTQLMMRQIEHYLQNPASKYSGKKVADWLKTCSLYYVPMLNPDGVFISQKGPSSVSSIKLRNQLKHINNGNSSYKAWKANARGVDLNRNFNAGWNKVPVSRPSFKGYKGPWPNSEPESKAIVNYINSNNFSALVAYHTSGNVIYWRYAGGGNITAAKALSRLTGYPIGTPDYSARNAGLKDWFILKHKKPGFTIEIGYGKSPVPGSQFNSIFNRNKYVPFCLAKNIKR